MSAKSSLIMTERAWLAIVAETYERIGTETGGILLGRFSAGTWYVIEVLDPGPKSSFSPTTFEYDDEYVTHLANKAARFYVDGISLIGLWHRHPGSYSTFSMTDDETNARFAALRPEGALSLLVNVDPEIRITAYHVAFPRSYRQITYQIADNLVPQAFLARKDVRSFVAPLMRQRTYITMAPALPDGLAQPAAEPQAMELPNKRGWLGQKLWDRLIPRARPTGRQVSGAPPAASDGASSASASNREVSERIFTLIEPEIDYLETQLDYSFTMRIEGREVCVKLEYSREAPYYPRQVNFAFGIHRGAAYVRVDGQTYPYTTGYIRSHIARVIAIH